MNSLITKTRVIPTNGIQLHAETAGVESGPLVILLHGFPEFWYGWRNQMSALARSGFFVVAPDQRGYNLSDKPQSVSNYRIDTLAQDVLGIMDYFGREKAAVVGHDWGAAVAWYLGIHFPDRVSRLGILNVPHPDALSQVLSKPVIEQLRRSWYIFFFQIPKIPEWLLSMARFAPLRQMLRASALPGTFSHEDLRRYTEAWSKKGRGSNQTTAIQAMINWYRSAFAQLNQPGQGAETSRVTVPTLILWGEKDIALIPQLASLSLEYCDQGELVRFPNASHWLQHDEPNRVANRMIDFLKGFRE